MSHLNHFQIYMDRTERFYKIDALLQANRSVAVDQLLRELEVSLATFKRDIEYMRERLHAPIVWDRELRGYRYDREGDDAAQALPGLWFNASEAYALLMMQSLLSDMQPGLLKSHIAPLKARLRALIESGHHSAHEVESRVRLLNVATRTVSDKHFEVVAATLLGRVRLAIQYYGRGRDESSERQVSPQQLLHYRGNWYLIAYCHVRNGLRSFAMDSIQNAYATQEAALETDAKQLEQFIGSGYGIYSGGTVQWARLRFKAPRSRWVAREVWHPEQKSQLASDGTLLLEFPFTDATELTMDILRHGKYVEVLEPRELKEAVMNELFAASATYSK